MKKRSFFVMAVSVIMIIGTCVLTSVKQQNEDQLSDLIFANIEALANDDESAAGGKYATIVSSSSEATINVEDENGIKYQCSGILTKVLDCTGKGKLQCQKDNYVVSNLHNCVPLIEVR